MFVCMYVCVCVFVCVYVCVCMCVCVLVNMLVATHVATRIYCITNFKRLNFHIFLENILHDNKFVDRLLAVYHLDLI